MTKLRKYMDDRGIKHAFVAQKVGISKALLSLYVNGLRVPPDVLARLADVLNCEPTELVGNVDEVTA